MAYSSKYSVEIWSNNGTLLADFAGRAMQRGFTKSRNQPEQIEFTLDLDEVEKYCRDLGIDIKNVFITRSTEVRVRRLGKYFVGGQIVYILPHITSQGNTLYIRADGFLKLFDKRYTGSSNAGLVSEVYTDSAGSSLSRKDLAWSLINQSQSLTNGDFGITRGLTGGSTTIYDKTYARTKIMDALVALTQLQTDPIDIEFTHDKVFNTYDSIGSNRPDVVFEYPGSILDIAAPDDGTEIANEVIGIGAGAADGTQAVYIAEDIPSQTERQLQQEVLLTSGTDNSDNGITDAAEAELAAKKAPIKIPAIIVNGNVAPYITDYGIGDRVSIKVNNHPIMSDINGMYRIEKMKISVDDNDNEQVTLEVSA